MVRGRVTGRLWSTKRIDTLPQGALLNVELHTKQTPWKDSPGMGYSSAVEHIVQIDKVIGSSPRRIKFVTM